MTWPIAGAFEAPFIRGAILGVGPAPLLAHVDGIRARLRPGAVRHARALAQLTGGPAKALARAESRLAAAYAAKREGDMTEMERLVAEAPSSPAALPKRWRAALRELVAAEGSLSA